MTEQTFPVLHFISCHFRIWVSLIDIEVAGAKKCIQLFTWWDGTDQKPALEAIFEGWTAPKLMGEFLLTVRHTHQENTVSIHSSSRKVKVRTS